MLLFDDDDDKILRLNAVPLLHAAQCSVMATLPLTHALPWSCQASCCSSADPEPCAQCYATAALACQCPACCCRRRCPCSNGRGRSWPKWRKDFVGCGLPARRHGSGATPANLWQRCGGAHNRTHWQQLCVMHSSRSPCPMSDHFCANHISVCADARVGAAPTSRSCSIQGARKMPPCCTKTQASTHCRPTWPTLLWRPVLLLSTLHAALWMQGPQDDEAFGTDPSDPDADAMRNGAAIIAECGHIIRLRAYAEIFDPRPPLGGTARVCALLCLPALKPLLCRPPVCRSVSCVVGHLST
jgi:hypothetical protein